MEDKAIGLFIKRLKRHKEQLTKQEYRTLKGQAINGDLEGAIKGLQKLLRRQTVR